MLTGRTLAPGRAFGIALVLGEPLSFWGGVDAASGRVIDGRHPQFGQSLSGRVLLLPSGRGSSSSSSVLAESIRSRTAPAAVLFLQGDPIVALGALVAQELYERSLPVVVLSDGDYRSIRTGQEVSVEAGPGDAVVRVGPANGG